MGRQHEDGEPILIASESSQSNSIEISYCQRTEKWPYATTGRKGRDATAKHDAL